MSIITVNLNNLKGLKKSMRSVFEQNWRGFEYIIIDGGSTDGSKEYIEQHNEKLSYWVSEPDKGVYNAMNRGIEKAQGEYLFFLNSGDWLHNRYVLEKVIGELFNCDVLYGNLVKVMEDKTHKIDKGPQGKEITLNTFFRWNLNHQATFIKRQLFDKYGLYDEKLKIVSDWKFFLIALGMNNSTVKYLDIDISFYDMSGISSNINLRDQEKANVLKGIIPYPIYADYYKLMEKQKVHNSNRYKIFRELEKYKIARKINSVFFRLLLKLINGKELKDL